MVPVVWIGLFGLGIVERASPSPVHRTHQSVLVITCQELPRAIKGRLELVMLEMPSTLALLRAGRGIPSRMAMIAITTGVRWA